MDDRSPEQTDTPGPATPGDPGSSTRAARSHRLAAVLLSVGGVLVAVLVPAGFLVRLPYVVISPGFATPLDDEVVQVEGAPTYEHDDDVMFLTVRVTTRNPTVWRVVTGWLDPDRQIVERGSVVGCLSDAENAVINDRLMEQSRDDATVVALTRLGYEVVADRTEFVVVEICPGVPAHGELRAGDQILTVDERPVVELADVGRLVRAHAPGEPVEVTYVRDGEAGSARVVAGRTDDGGRSCRPVQRVGKGTACLGVTMEAFVGYQFPVDVTIDTRRVGGPSAGLAFALAIIDRLTPGNLTGGKRVAVTGTIAKDGSVGPVGGVEQKAITARHNDVTMMIVPRSEIREARRGAGGVSVVGVDTIDDALVALRKAGGAVVPPAGAVAARS